MREVQVKVINQLGLHARAAAQLVKLSTKFNSSIKLHRSDSKVEADAKSILSILTLAASRGTVLNISIDGSDEDRAIVEIEEIFIVGFGEM